MKFESWSLLLLIAVFAGAAVAVWIAGTRLARLADAISIKTGIGQAAIGLVLLGAVTSLPEIAVATSATLNGAPILSINDVLGSASINLLILAIADAAYRREALTSSVPSIGVAMQGVVGIIVLALVALASATPMGEWQLLGVGWGSWLLLLAYAICIRILVRSRSDRSWRPEPDSSREKDDEDGGEDDRSLKRLVGYTIICALVILVAGFLLARTGEVLAEKTGLGTSFFGAVALGLATSLPELSTVLEAVRLRRYTMAISDVFGTNLFNVTIIVLVDILHRGGPVLPEAGPFAATAALLALILTAIYLTGMLERRDRTLLRMGFDSIAVVLVYCAGVVLLYAQR
jgi:cation:H+ antiporter